MKGEDRSYEYDDGIITRGEIRQALTHEFGGGHEVKVDDSREGVRRQVTKPADRAAAGGGHDRIESPETVRGGRHELDPEGGVADVAGLVDDAAAPGRGCGELFQPLRAAGRCEHMGAAASQFQRRRPADARRRARHDHPLAGEPPAADSHGVTAVRLRPPDGRVGRVGRGRR